MLFTLRSRGKHNQQPQSVNPSEVITHRPDDNVLTKKTDHSQQLYERIAQGHALAEIENQARNKRH